MKKKKVDMKKLGEESKKYFTDETTIKEDWEELKRKTKENWRKRSPRERRNLIGFSIRCVAAGIILLATMPFILKTFMASLSLAATTLRHASENMEHPATKLVVSLTMLGVCYIGIKIILMFCTALIYEERDEDEEE